MLEHGGALSHHHGVGLNRSRFVRDALGPAFDVLVAMKQALDPNGILNPGKLGLPDPVGRRRARCGPTDGPPRRRRRDVVGPRRDRRATTPPCSTSSCATLLPDSPAAGMVEFDAAAMAATVLDAATAALAAHGGPVDAVGITNQRGSDDRVGPRHG